MIIECLFLSSQEEEQQKLETLQRMTCSASKSYHVYISPIRALLILMASPCVSLAEYYKLTSIMIHISNLFIITTAMTIKTCQPPSHNVKRMSDPR